MMERALKERIIGAVVLVLVVVLVVPIFLDGPPDDTEIVSERVLLPGQDNQKTQTVVLERDREDPVPVASSPTPARQEPAREEPKPMVVEQKQPEAETTTPKPTPEPVKEPVIEQAAASTTGMWAVQLGSFSNKDNAEKRAADLRKQGYAAFLSEFTTDSGELRHRVRIGPQKDRDGAEEMARRLSRAGYEGQVVPHP
jgi:DedD protein